MKLFSRFEWALLVGGAAIIIGCYCVIGGGEWLSAAASLIGFMSLMLTARGYPSGQILMVVFGLVYGYISFTRRYYGEMITYVFMTAPIAAMSAVQWLRNPFEGGREVRVSERLSTRSKVLLYPLTAAVTSILGVLLWATGAKNLPVSILSVATSFIAAYLTLLRSPWYAAGYAANDLVLIALWWCESTANAEVLPVLVCFMLFFIGDCYGLISWRRMKGRQRKILSAKE